MKNISLVFSTLTIVLGAIAIYFGSQEPYAGAILSLLGAVTLFVGIAIIAVIFMYPAFGSSMSATIISLVACAGGVMIAIEMYLRSTGSASTPLMFGIGLVVLDFILCPCMCMQSGTKSKNSVIGIAAAHESITIEEISQKTGLAVDVVSSIVYDAIGKKQLSGRMDGNTFKRTGPAPSVVHDAKVLVICPYCGAKTEQGLAKCQKCGADI